MRISLLFTALLAVLFSLTLTVNCQSKRTLIKGQVVGIPESAAPNVAVYLAAEPDKESIDWIVLKTSPAADGKFAFKVSYDRGVVFSVIIEELAPGNVVDPFSPVVVGVLSQYKEFAGTTARIPEEAFVDLGRMSVHVKYAVIELGSDEMQLDHNAPRNEGDRWLVSAAFKKNIVLEDFELDRTEIQAISELGKLSLALPMGEWKLLIKKGERSICYDVNVIDSSRYSKRRTTRCCPFDQSRD